jgi:hypothetical protein
MRAAHIALWLAAAVAVVIDARSVDATLYVSRCAGGLDGLALWPPASGHLGAFPWTMVVMVAMCIPARGALPARLGAAALRAGIMYVTMPLACVLAGLLTAATPATWQTLVFTATLLLASSVIVRGLTRS